MLTKKLTGEEIIEIIKNSGTNLSNFATDCNISYNDIEEFPKEVEEDNNWRAKINYWLQYHGIATDIDKIEHVYQQGGEDEGSDWRSVWCFKEQNVYLEVRGWYQSDEGVEFEGWDEAVREVKPVEKTITVYE